MSNEEDPHPGESPLLPPKPDLVYSQLRPIPAEDGLPPRRPGKDFSDYTNDCNHTRITRIWDPDKQLRCSNCKQPTPAIGWLYRCVVDTDGHLPASDFYPEESHTKDLTTFIPNKMDIDTTVGDLDPAIISFIGDGDYTVEELNTIPKLKPWILKGISAGDYTHEHVKLFCKQLIQVQKAVRSDLIRSANQGRPEQGTFQPEGVSHPTNTPDMSILTGRPARAPDMSALAGQPGNTPTMPSLTSRAPTTPDVSALTGRPGSTPGTRSSTAASTYLNYPASDNTRPSTASSGEGSSMITRDPTLPTSTTISTLDHNANAEEVRRAYEWSSMHQEYGHLHPGHGPPDPRLPDSFQNLLKFDHISTSPLPGLRQEGYDFPELSDGFYTRQANQNVVSHPVKLCDYMSCGKCWPKSGKVLDRLDSIDDILNGPMPPMHEIMNRPVSDVRIVRNLGLRRPTTQNNQGRQDGQSYQSDQNSQNNQDSQNN